jgi:uncharacterized phage protein (TIGR02218 family)
MTGFIELPLSTVALCWRLERRDGVALGFTTHDRDLVIDGLVYRAAPGMVPSAISIGDGFDAGTLDVSGALTSDAIAADDLADGRWDGAAIFLFACDWENGGAPLPLARGEIGDVSAKGAGFEAELRGPAALLERAAVEQTSPECRAELGDKRCRVDMAPRRRLTRVVAVADEASVEVADASALAGAYAYGRLRWLTGGNSGLESAIVASDAALLTLREAPPQPAATGDLVEIAEGCDKSFATCTGRFANGANFRGEPHLPGMDLLTRYPGAS